MIENVTFDPLDAESLYEVWKNIREVDKEEIALQGIDEDNIDYFLSNKAPIVAKYKGKPVCVFGHVEGVRVIYLTLIGTKDIDDLFLTFFKASKKYVEYIADHNLDKKILVNVWEKHTTSIDWLKRLGFKFNGRKLYNGDNVFLFMELE